MNRYGLGKIECQHNKYTALAQQGHVNVQNLKRYINQPEYNRPKKTFSITEVERLVGVPRSTLRERERAGEIKYSSESCYPKKDYSIADINIIRQYYRKGFFNGQLLRPSTLQPFIISFSMFKGGVGKTTHATHFAAHCALSGLKTLLIDLDPQASATLIFGHIPSVDIDSDETILTSLIEDFSDIRRVIKNTHYDNLDIITSGLELQAADLYLPNEALNKQDVLGTPLLRLSKALSYVKDQYDVIVLDCAPNHAATTMNALIASNGIVLPIEPNMLSYGSSIQFAQTLAELSASLLKYKNLLDVNQIKQNEPHDSDSKLLESSINQLFRVLITNDPGDTEAQDVSAAIRSLYGDFVLPHTMTRTIALARSSNDLGLLYDIKRSEVRGSKDAHDRGIHSMKCVNDDLLTLLSSIWEDNN